FVSDGSNYLGTFSLDPVSETPGHGSVGWHFVASESELLALGANEVRTQTYTVTVHDGFTIGDASQDVTVTLRGSGFDHPILMSDYDVGFRPVFPIAFALEPISPTATVHYEGITGFGGELHYADGTVVQPGTDLTPDQYAGLTYGTN